MSVPEALFPTRTKFPKTMMREWRACVYKKRTFLCFPSFVFCNLRKQPERNEMRKKRKKDEFRSRGNVRIHAVFPGVPNFQFSFIFFSGWVEMMVVVGRGVWCGDDDVKRAEECCTPFLMY